MARVGRPAMGARRGRGAPGREAQRGRAAERGGGSGDAKRAAAAARLCGEPRIRGALALAATDLRVSLAADQLDADPHLLNAQNGVVDLRDGRSAAHRPARHMTKLAGADYLPGARSTAMGGAPCASDGRRRRADRLPAARCRLHRDRLDGRGSRAVRPRARREPPRRRRSKRSGRRLATTRPGRLRDVPGRERRR